MRLRYLLSGLGLLFCILVSGQQRFDLPQPTEQSTALQIESGFDITAAEGITNQKLNPFINVQEVQNPVEGLKRKLSMQLDKEMVAELYADNLDQISLTLPYFENETIQLELHQYDLLADGFHVRTSDNPEQAAEVAMGRYYRGVVKGNPLSTVAISIFQDEIIGMASIDGGNIVVHPAENGDEYTIYNDDDVTLGMPHSCEVLEHDEARPADEITGDMPESSNCVKVYLEVDHALYLNKGTRVATVNWITAVFNNMATLYANENITTAISEIFVWTTPDSYSTTSSYNALTAFRNSRRTFNGDIAHLAALGGRNIGGIAWLDVLCSSYGYAYSNINSSYQTVPTYSWTVEVMTHEMGHNLGSNHTQWCGWQGGALDNCYQPEGNCQRGPAPTNGGTIMSYCHLTQYGINFNNGFGTQPGNKIRNEVAAAGCLGQCGGGGCAPPTGLSASNITTTSALLSWASVTGATEYKLEYRTGTGSWTSVTTTNLSRTISGLTPNTLYEARVAAKCSGQYGTFSASINFRTLALTGCGTPTGLAASNVTSSSARLAWGSVNGALSYDLQYRPSGGSWTNVNTTSTSRTVNGLSANTTYEARVRAKCSGSNSSYTNLIQFTTQNTSSYCVSKGNNSNREWIRRVRTGTIDRSSGDDGGYFDATNLTSKMTKGQYNLVYFQAGKTGGSRRFYWRIWLDLNQDGDFNDSGELRVSGYSNYTGLLYSYVYLPTSATDGETRMRVSMRYGGYPNPCQTFNSGEVEDYTIDIVGTGNLQDNEAALDQRKDEWTLAPNPSATTTMLQYNVVNAGSTQISILDVNGKVLHALKQDSHEGHNFLDLNTDHLSTGYYFVQVRHDDRVELLRLVKM